MSLLPQSLQPQYWLERLRTLGRMLQGLALRVSLEETVSGLIESSLAARRRTTEAALSELAYADTIEVGQDDYRAKVVSAHKEDVAEITAITRQVLTAGPLSFEQGRETLERAPFDSAPSGAPPSTGETPQALPGGPPTVASDTTPPPARRKRGRPRKETNPPDWPSA